MSTTTHHEISVQVSERFYDDHVSRDLLAGREVRRAGGRVTVMVDWHSFAELESDASYYASFEGDDYRDNRSVCDAARRVLAALAKVTPPVYCGEGCEVVGDEDEVEPAPVVQPAPEPSTRLYEVVATWMTYPGLGEQVEQIEAVSERDALLHFGRMYQLEVVVGSDGVGRFAEGHSNGRAVVRSSLTI